MKKILTIIFCLSWALTCSGEDTYQHKYNPWTGKRDWVVDKKDASDIFSDISKFDTSLSSADNTVQKALDTFDDIIASGGTAPVGASYLVGAPNDLLSAEITVNLTPGGELGNTWASPTIASSHSGSAHHVSVTVTDSTAIDLTLSTQDIQADINETTSANWIDKVSDETGTGKWVFGTSPTFITSIIVLGTASSEIVNAQLFSSTGDIVLFPAGNNVVPNADNDVDLGAAGSDWKDLYMDGSVYVDNNQGVSGTYPIFNDGTAGNLTEIVVNGGIITGATVNP